jgi:hypothetical protein
MASKRRIRRKACEGKRQHETRPEANFHKMMLINNHLADPGSLWVYRCDFCKKWHVGHPPAKLLAKHNFHSGKS